MSETAQAPVTELAAAPVPLADCTRMRQIEMRYLKATDALVDDALENRSLDILVDVLTWELARLAIACDTPAAAADILKSLGKHMGEIVARRDAQAEAKAAKEKGALPH